MIDYNHYIEESGDQANHYHRWMSPGEYEDARENKNFGRDLFFTKNNQRILRYSSGKDSPKLLVRVPHIDKTFVTVPNSLDPGDNPDYARTRQNPIPFEKATVVAANHPDLAKEYGVEHKKGTWDMTREEEHFLNKQGLV
jgi:hypothetical protein